MKVKFLKEVVSKANPLISDVVPIVQALWLDKGRVSINNLQAELVWDCDCAATGEIQWPELKKILQHLDPSDDINFRNNGAKIDIFINNEKIGSVISVSGDPNEKSENTLDRPLGFSFPLQDTPHAYINKEDLPLLKKALAYVGTDFLRPALQCVQLGEHITATNGHKLYFPKAFDPIPTYTPEGYEPSSYFEQSYHNEDTIKVNNSYYKPASTKRRLLIHSRYIKLITDLAKDHVSCYLNLQYEILPEPKVKVHYSTIVAFTVGDMKLFIKESNDKYPDWENVVPQGDKQTNEVLLTVDRKELIKTVKMSLGFANPTTHQVVLSWESLGLKISSEDVDTGKFFRKEIPVAIKETENNKKYELITYIGCNAKFLIEVLSTNADKKVTIRAWESNRAMIIDGQILLMPTQVVEYAS